MSSINYEDIEWLKNKEDANEEVLNRPLKQFLDKFNIIIKDIEKNVEFTTENQTIKWKYKDESTWKDLYTVKDGVDGREVQMLVINNYVCWKYESDNDWIQLISVEELKGDVGAAATIEVGTVKSVSYNSPVKITNSGTESNAIFNFEIPKGVEPLTSSQVKSLYEGNPNTNAFTDSEKSDLSTIKSWGNHNTAGYAKNTDTQNKLNNKVDKEAGKGLSEENFTTEEKNKLASLEGSHFRGTFTSLSSLESSVTNAVAGDYADVDEGQGKLALRYIWDSTDNVWVGQIGESTTLTAAQVKSLYESNPNTNAFTDLEKSDLSIIKGWGNHNTAGYNKTVYTAGSNITITGGVISSTDTKYNAGTVDLANNGVDTITRVWSPKILKDWISSLGFLNTIKEKLGLGDGAYANFGNDNESVSRGNHTHSEFWDIVNATGYAPNKDLDDYVAGEGGYIRGSEPNAVRSGLDIITKQQYGSQDLLQIGFPQRNVQELYMRTTSNSTWLSWLRFWHSGNFDPSTKVDNTRQIIAGNGMTGGGTLGANRTLTLGTPSEVSESSTNSVTSTSHTHALGAVVKASLAKADSAMQPGDFGLGGNANSGTSVVDNQETRFLGWSSTIGQLGGMDLPTWGVGAFISRSSANAGIFVIDSNNGELSYAGKGSSNWKGLRTAWDNVNFNPDSKQDKLTAGTNVTINGSTISATNTTYSVGSLAQLNTGTETTGRLQSAKNLNDWLNVKLGGKLAYVEGSEKISITGNGTSANPYAIDFVYGEGFQNLSLGVNSVAGMYGVALGANTNASNLNSVALGQSSTTTKDYQVSIAQLAQSTGMSAKPRILSGVANPEVSQDAVNLQTFKPTSVFSVRTDTDMIRYLIDPTFSTNIAILNYYGATAYNLVFTSDNITHLPTNNFNRKIFRTGIDGFNFNMSVEGSINLIVNGLSVPRGKIAKVTYPGNRIFEVFSQRPLATSLIIDFGPLAEVTIE